jgi:hypothetical protein
MVGKLKTALDQKKAAEALAETMRTALTQLSHLSTHAIAEEFTKRKIRTPRGGDWTKMAVLRMQCRLGLPQ